jgi:predicted nucleic acid-binding protein
MKNSSQIFLDANVLIYTLDQTSEYFSKTVPLIQRLLLEGCELCTSHHVIEEVFHVARKAGTRPTDVIKEIAKIPNLTLIEPDADLSFAKRYAKLSVEHNLDINDALLLQLIIDAEIATIFTYDKKLARRSEELGIKLLEF